MADCLRKLPARSPLSRVERRGARGSSRCRQTTETRNGRYHTIGTIGNLGQDAADDASLCQRTLLMSVSINVPIIFIFGLVTCTWPCILCCLRWRRSRRHKATRVRSVLPCHQKSATERRSESAARRRGRASASRASTRRCVSAAPQVAPSRPTHTCGAARDRTRWRRRCPASRRSDSRSATRSVVRPPGAPSPRRFLT